MELCDDGHDEVCFDSRECPACALKSANDELVDAAKDLDPSDLESVSGGLELIRDTIKEFEPMTGSLDELLLTLSTSVKQLAPPWHDLESFQKFQDQVKQLDTLLMHINAMVNDRTDFNQWKSYVDTAIDDMGRVTNAVP